MQNHPSPLVRGNLIPLLGLLAWFSGGGLARAITDLLVSNPTTSSILRFNGFTVTSIDDQWERVLVQEPCTTTPRCFGIVEITLP